MSAPTEYTVDKSAWGDGPWQCEPDRAEWIHTGFACLAVRHPNHGFWCAYVGIPREHPLYGQEWTESETIQALEAHHGINYSARCDGDICHTPVLGMPDDVWWLGFDCGHFMDLAPGMEARFSKAIAEAPPELAKRLKGPELPERMREVYRTLDYVRAKTNALAEQLAAMKP